MGTGWHESVGLLSGLPLLPLKGKAPINPASGHLWKDWDEHFVGPAEVLAAPGATGCGLRIGPACGLIGFDLDGASGVAAAIAAGCDPSGVKTWVVARTGTVDRLKVLFRISPEQSQVLTVLKCGITTATVSVTNASGKKQNKREGIEIFHGVGQIVVCGEHPDGDSYCWPDGCGPDAVAPLPEAWMALALHVRDVAPSESRATHRGGVGVKVRGDGGEWRKANPCPICGRDQHLACTQTRDGLTVVCVDGDSFGFTLQHGLLKPGAVVQGGDGQRWAFIRSTHSSHWGKDLGVFRIDRPISSSYTRKPSMQQPKPAASSTERPTAPDVPAVDAFRRDIKAVIEQNLSGSPLAAYTTQKAVEYDISPSQAAEIRKELQQEYEVGLQAEQQGAALTADADREQFRKQHLTLDRLFSSGPLVDAIRIVTRGLNTDDFASACTFLTTVASVMPLGSTVRGNWDTFVVPTNTYMAIVGDSGTGKTQILKALAEMPLSALHQTATNNYNRALEQWREDNAGIKPADRSPQPDFIYVYVNGYTAEAADEQLAIQESHGKPLLIYNDELSRVFESLDCYTSKGRRGIGEAQLLRMFDGSGNVEIRMKGGRRYHRCLISILGGLQNDVFAKMAKDGDPYGTFARIMLCQMPPYDDSIHVPYIEPDKQTSRTIDSEHYLQQFVASIYAQLPRQVVLSPAAMGAFHNVISASKRLANDAEIKAHKAIYGKRAGYALRWAGLLHIVRMMQPSYVNHGDGISLETLTTAVDCVDQLQAYALRAHSCLASQGENAVHNIGERILKAAALKPNGITAGEFYRNSLSAKERRAYSSDAIATFFTQLVNGGHAVLDSSGKAPRLCVSP